MDVAFLVDRVNLPSTYDLSRSSSPRCLLRSTYVLAPRTNASVAQIEKQRGRDRKRQSTRVRGLHVVHKRALWTPPSPIGYGGKQ